MDGGPSLKVLLHLDQVVVNCLVSGGGFTPR